MNPDFPKNARQEVEMSLTALLLGELPAEKAAAVRSVIERDAELGRLYERLKLAIELVRETAARPVEQAAAQPAPVKLSEARREKLLQHFKTVAPKEFARPGRKRKWWLEVGAAAALVALMAVLFFPIVSASKRGSSRVWWDQASLTQPMPPAEVAALAAEAAGQRAEQEKQSLPRVSLKESHLRDSLTTATPAAKPERPRIVLPSADEQ